MTVYLNKEPLQTDSSNLASLLQEKALLDKKGIAVAVNNEVVQKVNWTSTSIQENDKILIITAIQGG
jgi:sulfur carrier protein